MNKPKGDGITDDTRDYRDEIEERELQRAKRMCEFWKRKAEESEIFLKKVMNRENCK